MELKDPREIRIRSRLAGRVQSLQPSPVRDLMPFATREGVVSLADGRPHPSRNPLGDFRLSIAGTAIELAADELALASQYLPSSGYPGLIDQIREWHQSRSPVELSPENICLTSGSREALFLLAYLFLEPGDPVVVSDPTSLDSMATFRCFTDNLVPVPQDRHGIDPDALRKILRRRQVKNIPLPKLLHLTPTAPDPTGISLPVERREALLELAAEFDLIVLDDDPNELLGFDDEGALPTVQSLDPDGLVLRVDSFSTILAPGLRLGYLSGHPCLISLACQVKSALNVEPSGLCQAILAKIFATRGFPGIQQWIAESRAFYRRQFRVLHEALRDFVGGRVRYYEPDGGFHLWLEIDDSNTELDVRSMLREQSEAVKFFALPGSAFSPLGGLANSMRLSFGQESEERLREGVLRLARMIHDYVTARRV